MKIKVPAFAFFLLLGFASCASMNNSSRSPSSMAEADFALKITCKAAASEMPNGSGSTVYYPNGKTLTSSAGKAGATWYYPNGKTLTSNVSVVGATYYYSNGNTFSSNTGAKGATWYHSNGNTITSSGPALSPKDMADLACDLILENSVE